jgi:dTDP-glucose 4,6-dehydratase
VNLGNPREMTILKFADAIRRAANSNQPFVYRPLPADDPKRRQPDISKAHALLGWQPEIELEDGIRETIAYFQLREARQPVTPTL